jgi:hypothetical protein
MKNLICVKLGGGGNLRSIAMLVASGQLFVNRPRKKTSSTKHRRKCTAFTLVELLVVIAII